MIWNFHVYYHFLMFWHVFLSLLMFWHYITATPLCLGMYYYNLPKFWNALLPLPDHYHFVFFNELPLSDILEGITTTFWLFFGGGECISTTYSSLGMHYHHSLMFWDILLSLSDVLECISILSLSCVFGIYFYQFWCFGIYNYTSVFYDVLVLFSCVLKCVSTTSWSLPQFPNELSLCRFGMYIYFLRHFGIYH